MEVSKHPVLNKKYQLISTLGEGKTSKVYLAVDKDTKERFAIKILREKFTVDNEECRKAVVNEVVALKSLQEHPNVIRIIEYGDDGEIVKPSKSKIGNIVFIVLEFVEGGILFDVCQTLGGLGEDLSRYFFVQLMSALDQMHNLQIFHRDLKLENILVNLDFVLKVADFGFAAI